MEALCVQPWEEDGMARKEEEEESGEQEEGGTEASSPAGLTSDEETDEDSEPEPPPVVRRKVSFADAFGLNLVSVKEFDNAEETVTDVSLPCEREAILPLEEFYMTCLFTVPSSTEELDQRLQAQMIELETIGLLPGTTTIRGIIRVVNLCYSKTVFARMSLDHWTSYFDLLAEYVPGSSDRKTDRFTFSYTLVPPFEREGTRLDICLRYETSVGTFWANNTGMNYVLFCHQRGHVNELGPHLQEESGGHRGKRSCLKAKRRGSADEKTREPISNTSPFDAETTEKEAERHLMDVGEIQSLLHRKEHKPVVSSIKSQRRATRLARVQDCLSNRRQQEPRMRAHDSVSGQKVSPPLPAPLAEPASFLHKRQSSEGPQVLTYHEIPLLTLDWNSDKTNQWGAAHVDDIWNGKAKMTPSNVEKRAQTPSVNDVWETFSNGADNSTDKETSVCDVWQAFLNGPSCTDHSGVPESEWLQTAASVSPSNDKAPKTENPTSSHEHEFQVGADTPTTLHEHASAACQVLSDIWETLPPNVALNTADNQPAEACVSGPRDDNTATQDASQRSETNSVTDTLQEFSLEGAPPVSEGSVDSSAECHKHEVWERGRDGIIGTAEGIGRDEPCTAHAADFVTSSGESETTDMTAMPESQNASAADRISEGARLAEGLSSSAEGQVTGTTHNTMDDTLAFRGTIRQGTKDGERFVFSTHRQGVEEGLNKGMENRVSTGEEIFRPQKTEECEISQRYADEKQREEFRLNRNSENPLEENESGENETRPAQSHADEFNPNQTCDSNFKQSRIMAGEFKLEESANGDASNDEGFEETKVEPFYCTTSKETKRLIGADGGITQVLNEEAWQHNDEALQPNSSWEKGETSIFSEAPNEQFRLIQAEDEQCFQEYEEDSKPLQSSPALKFETGAQEDDLHYDGLLEEKKEINPSEQKGHSDHEPFRPFSKDTCNPNAEDMIELRWTLSKDDKKGHKEDVGAEEVVAKEESIAKADTSVERQVEALERIEEDMSQKDTDEGVSIGELKIEALGESIGNVGNPQGKRKNGAAQLKEQELSTEVECSPRVECTKLSEGTKDPITAENTGAIDVIEPGVEEMFIERFGEDLVRGIWEEVNLNLKVEASNRDIDNVEGMASKMGDIPDITRDCHLPFEKDFSDAFDSGVFSLTELPSNPNSSLSQDLEQTLATKSDENSSKEKSQPLVTTEQTQSLSESRGDANSSAHLCQDLTSVLAAQSRQSLAPANDQDTSPQIKARSVTRQETGRKIEESVAVPKESFNRSDRPSHKHPSPSSEKLKKSDSLSWWSMLYVLSRVVRLLICTLLVAGFFLILFLCDLPVSSALYVFSFCCWFYMWKRHRVTANKGMVG